MLRGKVEGEMALLSEGPSVKESPEDKQTIVPMCQGKCQDFTEGHSGMLHQCRDINQPPFFRVPMHHFNCCEWDPLFINVDFLAIKLF